jgi:hypothetical protein
MEAADEFPSTGCLKDDEQRGGGSNGSLLSQLVTRTLMFGTTQGAVVVQGRGVSSAPIFPAVSAISNLNSRKATKFGYLPIPKRLCAAARHTWSCIAGWEARLDEGWHTCRRITLSRLNTK